MPPRNSRASVDWLATSSPKFLSLLSHMILTLPTSKPTWFIFAVTVTHIRRTNTHIFHDVGESSNIFPSTTRPPHSTLRLIDDKGSRAKRLWLSDALSLFYRISKSKPSSPASDYSVGGCGSQNSVYDIRRGAQPGDRSRRWRRQHHHPGSLDV